MAERVIQPVGEFKENLNACKPSDQSKGLGGNIVAVGTKTSTCY